jgi:hypothetical protein
VIAVVAPPIAGGVALPAANAQVRRGRANEVRVEPDPHEATVVPRGVNIRTLPGLHGRVFDVAHSGDTLNVAGFTHDWAAVDRGGRLGFVHRKLLKR